jgi:uncharacterized repeat protein (TIGR01451 family)
MSRLVSRRLRLALFSTFCVTGLALTDTGGSTVRPEIRAMPRAGIAALSAPSNDDCASAIDVGPLPFTSVPVDITEATPIEADDGFHPCATLGGDRTIWYRFSPLETREYVITTCPDRGAAANTVYDTVLSIFDGSAGCPAPGSIRYACDDPFAGCSTALPGAPYNGFSTITAVLDAGSTYYIVAGHWTGDTGGVTPGFTNMVVHVEPSPAPPNDTCANPTPLTLNQIALGDTTSAADNYRNTFCFSGIGQNFTFAFGRDVVYSFLAPSNGRYSFRYVQDDASAALRSQNPVLYVSHDCPPAFPTNTEVDCIKAANRLIANGPSNGNRSEEIDCVPLTAGEQVYLYFDDAIANDGGPLAVEVTRCVREAEPNDTIAAANPYPGCELRGAANTTADVDFFSLGMPPAGSKVFLGLDGVAANDGDFELRLTNTTDTLGYDDNDGTSWVSANAPIIAGVYADGNPLYARVNKGSLAAQLVPSEPYHLYARIETGVAQAEIDDPSNASYYFGNHVTGGGFVTGVMATQTDQDCFRFVAHAGDEITVFSDNNPSRTPGTITNVWPILRDVVLGPPTATRFTGQVVRNILTASPGTLTGTTPSVTSEFYPYRARYTGTYMVCFNPTTDSANAVNPPASAYPLPYQGSISLNCGPIPAPATRVTDVAISKTANAAGTANTGSLVTYTITTTNLGSDIAEDVRLVDTLPPELVFLQLSADDGFNGNNVFCVSLPAQGEPGGTIDCTNLSLAPGASTTYTLVAQVTNCSGAGHSLANTASITTLSTDPNPSNNSATVALTTTEDGSCQDVLCDGDCFPNACTVNDYCEAGVCVSTPIDCDDHSVCTDDFCDPSAADGAPCHHDPIACLSDGSVCTDDHCDPVLGCLFDPIPGRACNDQSPCTTNDICDAYGQCIGHSQCDDGLPCTDDFADDQNGCACSNPLSFPGSPCDDGDVCTTGETCDGLGGSADHCVPAGVVSCDDGNLCTDDSCDPTAGCVHTNNTAACSDGNACTDNDACSGGACHGVLRNCDDANSCTADSCNPAGAGLCVHDRQALQGQACDDGNACLTGETCDNGQCQGGTLVFCNDGNPCTSDFCQPSVGCVSVNNEAPCDDGNACTVNDTCGGGSCQGGAPVVCTASDQCHVAGTCDPGSGACSNPAAPDGTTCDDGNPGTSGDACQAGVCTGGTVCNPTNDPKTWGWYNSLCTSGGHSGDAITNADAACVAATTGAFSGVTTAAQVCEILSPAHGSNSQADKAEKQLMTLTLNICKQRICPAQGLDATCTSADTVGQARQAADVVQMNPGHTNQQLATAECQSKEINNGRALELNTLGLKREGSSVRLTWEAPLLDDGTGSPAKYKVWRRPAGTVLPFAQMGVTTSTTYLDTIAGSGAWQYNVTSVF